MPIENTDELEQKIVDLQNQINNLTSLISKNEFSNTVLSTKNNIATSGGYQSANFVSGSMGWRFDAEGNLEANAGTFRGALSGNTITIGTNAWKVDSSGNMWWGSSTTYAGATIKISAAGSANLSGLVVGTNVGIGTAFPAASAGNLAYQDLVSSAMLDTTVIVGGYIKTSLLTADNIITGTLTGRKIQTHSGAEAGIKLQVSDYGTIAHGYMEFWDDYGDATYLYVHKTTNVIHLEGGDEFYVHCPIRTAYINLAAKAGHDWESGDIINYAYGATDQFRGRPGDGTWDGSFDMTAI